jgi:putative heme iron utilization protein
MVEEQDPAAEKRLARQLLRAADRGALATIFAEGEPYASLVLVALDLDAAPLLLLSDLAEHSHNISRNPRVSLLIDGTGGLVDPLAGPRVSLIGWARVVSEGRLLARYIARHPSAEAYAWFSDFKLYRMEIERAHLVAGFGRIRWIEGKEIHLAGDVSALAAAEPDILAALNADQGHALERRLGRGPGWRLTGIDPEGADFRREGEISRLDFAAEVRNADQARAALMAVDPPRRGEGA